MSALCQKQTFCAAVKTSLFDHLVGADEQCRRHGDPERFCRLEIDNCVKFGPTARSEVRQGSHPSKSCQRKRLPDLSRGPHGRRTDLQERSGGANAVSKLRRKCNPPYSNCDEGLPEQPVMRDLYKSQPASCKPLGELTEVAMRGPSPFTQGQRELIAAYVSGLNACNYCHATHAGVAAAFGVEPELFNALLTDIDLAPVEDRMKPILRYARKLTLSPARMSEADAAALYEAGWGDEALYSTVLVAALFNFYNRLVDGVGLALPEGYVAEAAKRLSTQGYNVFAQIAKA